MDYTFISLFYRHVCMAHTTKARLKTGLHTLQGTNYIAALDCFSSMQCLIPLLILV